MSVETVIIRIDEEQLASVSLETYQEAVLAGYAKHEPPVVFGVVLLPGHATHKSAAEQIRKHLANCNAWRYDRGSEDQIEARCLGLNSVLFGALLRQSKPIWGDAFVKHKELDAAIERRNKEVVDSLCGPEKRPEPLVIDVGRAYWPRDWLSIPKNPDVSVVVEKVELSGDYPPDIEQWRAEVEKLQEENQKLKSRVEEYETWNRELHDRLATAQGKVAQVCAERERKQASLVTALNQTDEWRNRFFALEADLLRVRAYFGEKAYGEALEKKGGSR